MSLFEAPAATNLDLNYTLGHSVGSLLPLAQALPPFELYRAAVDAGCVTAEDFEEYFSVTATVLLAEVRGARIYPFPAFQGEVADAPPSRVRTIAPYTGRTALAAAGG